VRFRRVPANNRIGEALLAAVDQVPRERLEEKPGAIMRTSSDGSHQARMSSWSTQRLSTVRKRTASSRLGRG
jgi:hypothetical protein